MTIRELKTWLAELPPEMDKGDVCSVVHGMPLTAKRVVAFVYNDNSGYGIVVNSMGTHLNDEFYKSIKKVSIL